MSSSDSIFLPYDNGENGNESFTQGRVDIYSRFLIYLSNAVEDLSSGVSEDQYVNYLGKLSVMKKSKSLPGKMQKRMKSMLKDSLTSEINELVEEENIKENLQKLETLIDESMLQEGQEVWRPNGNVNDHMRSHLMEVKLKHKDELIEKVTEKEEDFECVLRKLTRLRFQVRSLESRLQLLKSQCEDTSVVDRIDRKINEYSFQE